MSDPGQSYKDRLASRTRELEAIRRRYDVIAWSRLGAVLTCFTIAIVSWRWSLGTPGWAASAMLLVVFIVLVIVHGRLARTRERAEAAIAWHKRALERLDGKWTSFPERGDACKDDAHPYALDLDIYGQDSLLQYLNDTRTPFGERNLASWLAAPAPRPEILERQQAVRELSEMYDLRESVFVEGTLHAGAFTDPDPLLRWCDQPTAAAIPGWLRALAWLLPALLVADIVAASYAVAPGWPAFALFVLNLLVLQSLRARLQPTIEATGKRSAELARYGSMLALLERADFKSPALRAIRDSLRSTGATASVEIAKLSHLVSWLDARQNGAFRTIIGPALLWDLHWVAAIQSWQRRVGPAARTWLDCVGRTEALASLATFSFEHPNYAMPEIDENPLVFDAKGLGHPLLEGDRRVVNDVQFEGPGTALLVTGSNMSGKSTLLRAIGVAAVLAMAGAPVCAGRLRIGQCTVRTSMRVSDSLRDGISRFYAELLKLKGVVESARSGAPVLFLLDEILHGTNSRERHIGARSILRTLLAHGATGAVSTHDLALADLEQATGQKVRNVHFEEQVVEGKMTFDYLLRGGVVRSGNALQWMRQVGLEVDGEG
jgi:ABC-type multidrug transport system fused ATPase/permease subunit